MRPYASICAGWVENLGTTESSLLSFRSKNEKWIYMEYICIYYIYIIYLHNIWKVVFLWKEKRILSFLCFSQRTMIPESVCIHIYMKNSKGKKGMKKSSLTWFSAVVVAKSWIWISGSVSVSRVLSIDRHSILLPMGINMRLNRSCFSSLRLSFFVQHMFLFSFLFSVSIVLYFLS